MRAEEFEEAWLTERGTREHRKRDERRNELGRGSQSYTISIKSQEIAKHSLDTVPSVALLHGVLPLCNDALQFGKLPSLGKKRHVNATIEVVHLKVENHLKPADQH